MHSYISIGLFLFLFISCKSVKTDNNVTINQPITPEEIIKNNIDSLKIIAKEGDLITRLGDDFISDRIRFLSEKDHSFSHVGIIVNRQDKKMVCHIYPEDKPGADTIRYEFIDSFINPKKNISCGLFRYNFSDSEKKIFLFQLDQYHKKNVHFDMRYDIRTDKYLYCSEMIYKSLRQATHDRILCKLTLIPENMMSLMMMYFHKFKPTKRELSERKFMSIDNLYNIPECKEIMRFKLKYFPGQ